MAKLRRGYRRPIYRRSRTRRRGAGGWQCEKIEGLTSGLSRREQCKRLPRRISPLGTAHRLEDDVTAFAIPPKSVVYWLERLQAYHVHAERARDRLGEEVIR